RQAVPTKQVLVDARQLGELGLGVATPLRLQHALYRQQRQAVLRNRPAKLLERDTVSRELLEELPARLASLPPRSLQQALSLEVDRHTTPSRPTPVSEPEGSSPNKWILATRKRAILQL